MSRRAPYHDGPGVTLYVGDAAAVLAELPPASAHCCVTSPPYWGLRDYGTGTWVGGDPACAHSTGRGSNTAQTRQPAVDYPASAAHRGGDPRTCRRCGALRHDGQYGLEPTPQEYVDNLRVVFAELRRVLVDDGTVWLNLGDSYSAGVPGRAADPTPAPAPDPGTPAATGGDRAGATGVGRTRAIPAKNLLGMPWRVAFGLQEDGWIIRNAIVWHKPNRMPEAVADRLSTRYEMLFLLARQPHYHFDLDPLREPPAIPGAPGGDAAARGPGAGFHAGTGRRRVGRDTGTGKYTGTCAFAGRPPGRAMRPTGRAHAAAHPHGRNPGDVWTLSTRPLKAAHFAAFPVDIPLRCIAAGCPPGGVVLDPFSGASTTGLAARRLGRSFVGIDLNAAFHDIAIERLGLAHGRPDAEGNAA